MHLSRTSGTAQALLKKKKKMGGVYVCDKKYMICQLNGIVSDKKYIYAD